MRLHNKEINHSSVGLEWETINTKWIIICDENDFNGDPKMVERFKRIEVTQRDYPKDSKYNHGELTWFKGSRTNHFDIDSKNDKQKIRVIEIVNEFLLNNDIIIEKNYKPVDINKQTK